MAKTKAQSVADNIKALTKGGGFTHSQIARGEHRRDNKAPVENIEKSEKNTVEPKGTDGRKRNGGKRPGSGRKPIELDEKRKTFKRSWEDFGNEEIEVSELHAGTKEVRKVKAKRIRIVQERLFAAANKGDVSAIKEFNDRIGGKARQPVVGDAEEDPVQVDLGVDRLLERAYGEEQEDD